MSRSDELFERAVKVIPGGVNSPVRAYGSVGMTPRFIEGASGPYVVDADSKKYIDYISSWGPMILGHNNQEVLNAVIRKAESGLSFGAATEIEVEMAEFICENIPSIEMIRMVNSGTEAVMSAIRAARGYTGRNKIVKFAGCYHGHSDALLVKAGSGVMTAGIPDSAGVPAGATQDTLTAVYNNLESVKMLFEENEGQIAAVIVEPVAANMGVVLPKEGFLKGLRELCTNHGAVLIFDEVITGFRLAFAGAQERFGIEADLVTYGKIIVLKGIIILLCIAFAAYLLQLHTVSWILSNTMGVGITAILIVFQPELRSALEQLGRKNWVTDIFSTDSRQEELEYTARTLQEISRAAIEMGKVKTGALIVLQREVALGEYERTGIPIDAKVSSQLLINIFEHNTPLHDGAVIIHNNRIVSATCYLPLSDSVEIGKEMGTRHRAAVGISEVSDSITVIVSEETGGISIARDGKIIRHLDPQRLRDELAVLREEKGQNKKFKLWKGRNRNEKKNGK